MSWLSIVGIGEDGVDGLGEAAKRAVVNADYVFGGARHLELASALSLGESRPWLTPFSQSIEAILALRGKAVCVLASGDPMHFGVGATLSRQIKTDEITVYPHPSSFSLAAARLGWPLQEAVTLSLHGRPIELLRPHLHAGVRIIALTGVRWWKFSLPVFIGDTIHVNARVVEKTVKGRGRRGEVVWYRGIVNQEGKTVQEGEITMLVECRPLTQPIEESAAGGTVATRPSALDSPAH